MSTAPVPPPTTASLHAAQVEADRLHRSGSMMLLSMAAFWGIAAALYQWGSPLAGQIALLIGTAVAYPVAWMVLKLAGGPAMLPRSNPLVGLSLQVAAIPLVGVLGAMALAQARPDAFFAGAMLGLSAAALPTVTLYGRRIYWVLAAVFLLLPVIAWFAAEPLLPWFGLIGIVVLLVCGALFLRSLGGLAAAPGTAAGEELPDAAEISDKTRAASDAEDYTSTTGRIGAAPTERDPDPYGVLEDDAVITDADLARGPQTEEQTTTIRPDEQTPAPHTPDQER